LTKDLFFFDENFDDLIAVSADFGEIVAVEISNNGNNLLEEVLLDTEFKSEADGSAQ